MSKEASARIKINKLLEESGWRFLDTEEGLSNISLEGKVKITKQMTDAWGNDFEETSKGYIDYLLLDDNGHPLIVLEAKKEEIHPLSAKEQARDYAVGQKVRYIILSNGNAHYFWDIEEGNPEQIIEFPSADSLQGRINFKPDKELLVNEVIEKDYIAKTQRPDYALDPDWIGGDTERQSLFLHNSGLKMFREYQLNAIKSVQTAVAKSQE